jgi:hypothetical protein
MDYCDNSRKEAELLRLEWHPTRPMTSRGDVSLIEKLEDFGQLLSDNRSALALWTWRSDSNRPSSLELSSNVSLSSSKTFSINGEFDFSLATVDMRSTKHCRSRMGRSGEFNISIAMSIAA